MIVTHDQEEPIEVANTIVVMNQGRIEQIGSPAEIYDVPVSPFVMCFVGEVNVFTGDSLPLVNGNLDQADAADGCHGGAGDRTDQVGDVGGLQGRADGVVSAGADALEPWQSDPVERDLFIRPHYLDLLDEPQERSFPAVLQRLIHLGRDVHAELLLDNGQLICAQVPRERFNAIENNLSQGSRLHLRPRIVHLFN